MILIASEHGQSVQLFVPDEVHPVSGIVLSDLVRGISERYAFGVLPPNFDTLIKEGAKFQHGRLIRDSRVIAIKELAFFTDGIIVQGWNTDDADLVLEDVYTWATENFHLREPRTIIPRSYTSSIVVEFNFEIDAAIEKFNGLMKSISLAISEIYGRNVEIKVSRLAFSADPTTLPQPMRFDFTIERRAGRPYEENRYFSVAPLPMARHILLLEELERQCG